MNSYSKNSEDIIIKEALDLLGIKAFIRYLDIGTSYPIFHNSTYFLYENGNTGVLVEPLPNFIKLIKEKRPKDLLIEGVIWFNYEPKTFVKIIGENGINSRGMKNKPLIKQKDVLSVNQYRINNVLLSHFFYKSPDLLDLNVCGSDLFILKELDFERFTIPVVSVFFGSRKKGITEYMNSKGYKEYKSTISHGIFIRDKNGKI